MISDDLDESLCNILQPSCYPTHVQNRGDRGPPGYKSFFILLPPTIDLILFK